MRVSKTPIRGRNAKTHGGRLESVGPSKIVYRLKTPITPLDLRIEGDDDMEGFDPYNSNLGKTSD